MRSLLSLVVVLILGYVATTVGCGSPNRSTAGWPYSAGEGKLTFVGHVRAIWHTDEVQDLKNGIEDEAGPAAQKLKHKVHEVTADESK